MSKLAKKLLLSNSIYKDEKLTYTKLFAFFIPLGTSTLLITVSNLILNRCMGYIPNSEFYISSFSVARTLMQLFMSPVSIISLVITTFIQNTDTFKKVNKFALVSVVLLVAWFYILSFTSVGSSIFSGLYNLDGELLKNAVYSLKTICILPLLFFIRNYFLGIAIKLRNIKFATLGSLLRVFFIIICSAFMPEIVKTFKPEFIPGLLLFGMVLIETVVYTFGVLFITRGKIISQLKIALINQNIYCEDQSISYKRIILFSLPLILSYSMGQLLPSFSQSALALGQNNETILTVYSVSFSLIYIISAFNYEIPQLVVNHDTFNPKNKNIIRKFCFIIAAFMTALMLLITVTNLGEYLFLNLLKLSPSNLDIAKISLFYGLMYPASTVFMSYKRGKLIKIQKTALLVFEQFIGNFISLILFVLIPIISWKHGAGAGILTLTAANFATGIFNHVIFKISVKKNPELIPQS